LKLKEKPERKSALDGLPKSLPALLRAQRMHEKITNHGGKQRNLKLEKELENSWKKFSKSLSASKPEKEKAAGEFLLTFVQLAHSAGIHAEMSLQKASGSYEKSFRKSEKKVKSQ
jgi:uncharacterized protein YabN with tetrapyrrole methylase and pyrophosphatase domain